MFPLLSFVVGIMLWYEIQKLFFCHLFWTELSSSVSSGCNKKHIVSPIFFSAYFGLNIHLFLFYDCTGHIWVRVPKPGACGTLCWSARLHLWSREIECASALVPLLTWDVRVWKHGEPDCRSHLKVLILRKILLPCLSIIINRVAVYKVSCSIGKTRKSNKPVLYRLYVE